MENELRPDASQAPSVPDSPLRSKRKTVSLVLLATFFVVAGANHFLNPRPYLAMIPPYIPFPDLANLLSGAAEITGGIAILVPHIRRIAGWELLILLVAVFPANVHVALHGWDGVAIPTWIFWARLPFQLLIAAWVYFSCVARV